MSGFVVGFGNPQNEAIEKMFAKIEHRGPDVSGRVGIGKAVMAQNYFLADGASHGSGFPTPVKDLDSGLTICYDGQMGNLPDLAAKHNIPPGPFREERTVLELYKKYGSGVTDELDDTIFAFVISDGEKLFAARDLLGIKTMFCGRHEGTLYLASELKSIAEVTEDLFAFPAGHHMVENGHMARFADLPTNPPPVSNTDLAKAAADIRGIVRKSLRNRVDFSHPTASLLSGGIDSSAIAAVATEAYREKFGKDAKLKTFALGVGESEDIKNARLVADRIGSDHHELIVGLDDILEVLPTVIYYLENFDPSLVRSSASNFLISRYAKKNGVNILLSGEGGDEVFCGYLYLKNHPLEELHARQMECMRFLHNNASLRLDRMNQCNGIKVVAPLISGELLNYSMGLPPEFKQKPRDGDRTEKYIFRKAFEDALPEAVVWRLKQEFSQGSGSAAVLPSHFETVVSDQELSDAQKEYPIIRSKEELFYFRIFTERFGSKNAIDTVGQWLLL